MSEWSGLGGDIKEIKKYSKELKKEPNNAELRQKRDSAATYALEKVQRKRDVAKFRQRTGALMMLAGGVPIVGGPIAMWGEWRLARGTWMRVRASSQERKITRAVAKGR